MLNPKNVRIAAQPIIWSNDDFHDLGGDTPLERCLSEMREAGYAGTELGHKFPKDPVKLKPLLQPYGLQLVSGWHSTYLAARPFAAERSGFIEHLAFLKAMGSPVVIVAECSYRTYNDPSRKLAWEFSPDEPFSSEEWKNITTGLEEFAKIAEDSDMKLVYHHHMGTGIQSLRQTDRLMEHTRRVLLVGDTGHLAFAGEDPLAVFKKYQSRIGHVHLKNVRPAVVTKARTEKWSFDKAVREGVFTVPGDGGIDYKPIFEVLERADYAGWMVVEAEQDPKKAPPLEYAKRARAYIKATAGV